MRAADAWLKRQDFLLTAEGYAIEDVADAQRRGVPDPWVIRNIIMPLLRDILSGFAKAPDTLADDLAAAASNTLAACRQRLLDAGNNLADALRSSSPVAVEAALAFLDKQLAQSRRARKAIRRLDRLAHTPDSDY